MVVFYGCIFVVFFFKQKTAYDMRISDWSSDVCSSDLERDATLFTSRDMVIAAAISGRKAAVLFVDTFNGGFESENVWAAARVLKAAEIGRASGRERVCQ